MILKKIGRQQKSMKNYPACLLVSSADNLYKQFGPRSGRTTCLARSGSKLFDTLMVFLKEFFEKVDFEKTQQRIKWHELPSMQRVNAINSPFRFLCSIAVKPSFSPARPPSGRIFRFQVFITFRCGAV